MSEKTCVVCGKPIPENRTSNNVKYCSAKCGRQVEKEKHMGYIAERSKRSNASKKRILKLYGYKCAICGWQISPDLITDTKGHYQHSHGNEMHHIIPVSISTHTPLAGRDAVFRLLMVLTIEFLLTRPSRGATRSIIHPGILRQISTHTPLAGRDTPHHSDLR